MRFPLCEWRVDLTPNPGETDCEGREKREANTGQTVADNYPNGIAV